MIQPTLQLNNEQIAFFHENGYLVIDAITTAVEIALIKKVYDRIFAARAGREEGNQFDLAGSDEEDREATLPQILKPEQYAPELQETLYKANATRIAQQLLGAEQLGTGSHAILKPPQTGAATPIHQDEAYWNPQEEHNGLSIWMPLQDTTIEMGCMQFIPGSHRLNVLPHRSIGGDVRVHGLEVDPEVTDLGELVACPIPAGGATIHHCRTLHFAGPNRTNLARRAYILAFTAPAKPLAKPRDFYWQKAWQTGRMARAQSAKM